MGVMEASVGARDSPQPVHTHDRAMHQMHQLRCVTSSATNKACTNSSRRGTAAVHQQCQHERRICRLQPPHPAARPPAAPPPAPRALWPSAGHPAPGASGSSGSPGARMARGLHTAAAVVRSGGRRRRSAAAWQCACMQDKAANAQPVAAAVAAVNRQAGALRRTCAAHTST